MVTEVNSQVEDVKEINPSPKRSEAKEPSKDINGQESKDLPQHAGKEDEAGKKKEEPQSKDAPNSRQEPSANPLQTSTIGELPAQKVSAQLTPPNMTCNQRRSTSYTQLRPTRISQPKPTTAQAQSSTAQLTLAMPVPLALAPKRSKTSMSPTSSVKRAAPAAFVEPRFLEILRPQFTPGPALRTPSSVAPPLDNPELRQLKEELQLLRVQKSEDKLKLLELERMRIHNEQLMEFKSQIMTQQVLLQRELQRSRHELREAQDVSSIKRNNKTSLKLGEHNVVKGRLNKNDQVSLYKNFFNHVSTFFRITQLTLGLVQYFVNYGDKGRSYSHMSILRSSCFAGSKTN